MSNRQFEAYLVHQDISGLDIENTILETDEDYETLKQALRLRFPVFCSNIVKILLFREEEKLACFLTAYYEVHIFVEMIGCAVDKGHLQWLNYLWGFGKNFLGTRRHARDIKGEGRLITFRDLFKWVKQLHK